MTCSGKIKGKLSDLLGISCTREDFEEMGEISSFLSFRFNERKILEAWLVWSAKMRWVKKVIRLSFFSGVTEFSWAALNQSLRDQFKQMYHCIDKSNYIVVQPCSCTIL